MRNPHAAQPECVALALDVVNAWSVERHGQFGQEAGSSRPPKLSSSSASRPRQGLHAGPALLSSHHRGATGLSVSIPSGSATMARSAATTEDSRRTSGIAHRWLVVRIRGNTVGLVPGGLEALSRPSSYFP